MDQKKINIYITNKQKRGGGVKSPAYKRPSYLSRCADNGTETLSPITPTLDPCYIYVTPTLDPLRPPLDPLRSLIDPC